MALRNQGCKINGRLSYKVELKCTKSNCSLHVQVTGQRGPQAKFKSANAILSQFTDRITSLVPCLLKVKQYKLIGRDHHQSARP